jgi:hypothetical protein
LRQFLIGALCVASLLLGATTARAETFAVLVGINDYRYFGVRDLRYSESDAELMRDTLIAHCDVPPENIRVLVGREATRRAIGLSIRVWLAERATPDDRVLFYFAGHGTQLQDDNGDEADGLDESLWAWDTGVLDLTWVRDDDLNRWLGMVSAREKIVILDCCHSGTGSRFLGEHSVRAASAPASEVRISSLESRLEAEREITGATTDAATDATIFTVPSQESAVAEFAACRPHQLVVETAQYKHGALTYFLTEGMSGAADADVDGVITLGELRTYSARRIQEHGFAQEPQLYGVGAPSFVLVAGPPPTMRGEATSRDAAGGSTTAPVPPPVWEGPSPYLRVGVAPGFLPSGDTADPRLAFIFDAVTVVEGIEAPSELPPDVLLTHEALGGSAEGWLVRAVNALTGELHGEWSVTAEAEAEACGAALQSMLRGLAARKALLAIQNIRSPLRVQTTRAADGTEVVTEAGAALFALSVARDGSVRRLGGTGAASTLGGVDAAARKAIVIAGDAPEALRAFSEAPPADAWRAITHLRETLEELPSHAWGAVAIVEGHVDP